MRPCTCGLYRKGARVQSGPLLAEKASELHQKMELDSEFTASKGWLWRFCKRHGIR